MHQWCVCCSYSPLSYHCARYARTFKDSNICLSYVYYLFPHLPVSFLFFFPPFFAFLIFYTAYCQFHNQLPSLTHYLYLSLSFSLFLSFSLSLSLFLSLRLFLFLFFFPFFFIHVSYLHPTCLLTQTLITSSSPYTHTHNLSGIDCSGNGVCKYVDAAGNMFPSCTIFDVQCKSLCTCSVGYGGKDCSLTSKEVFAKNEIRYSFV